MKKEPRLFYRRKILMALLQDIDFEPGVDMFQKYLFLLSENQDNPAFDFVPSESGPVSYQSLRDIRYLKEKDLIIEKKTALIHNKSAMSYLNEIEESDKRCIVELLSEFGSWKNQQLLEYIISKYPFYVREFKSPEYRTSDSENDDTVLYTQGYEGRSIDFYLNVLIQKEIKMLADVRDYPGSRKYGFSKKHLNKLCSRLGIKYIHFKPLGIKSAKRKSLDTKEDYLSLFEEYESSVLEQETETLDNLKEKIVEFKKSCLICYEADPDFCHRSRISNAVNSGISESIFLEHL